MMMIDLLLACSYDCTSLALGPRAKLTTFVGCTWSMAANKQTLPAKMLDISRLENKQKYQTIKEAWLMLSRVLRSCCLCGPPLA